GGAWVGSGGGVLPAADNVQGIAAAALVRPVGPGNGGGAFGQPELHGVCRPGAARRHAGSHDDLAVPGETGQGWADRPAAGGVGAADGWSWGGGSSGNADRRLDRDQRGAAAEDQ